MALVRFNALAGTWELKSDSAQDFTPITNADAQRALFDGVRQAPMWKGPQEA